jgi:hypothetical protein
VPPEKLITRFPRTLANLRVAIQTLPEVLIFDNDDLAAPFRKVAEDHNGKPFFVADPVPEWLRALIWTEPAVMPGGDAGHHTRDGCAPRIDTPCAIEGCGQRTGWNQGPQRERA